MNSDVAHFTTHQSTCLVTNQVAAGCEKLLQTVEIRSTFVIKSVHDVHFTDPRQSCFAINDGISTEVQKNINKPKIKYLLSKHLAGLMSTVVEEYHV